MFDMFGNKLKVKTVQDSIDQVLAKMEKEEAMQQNPSMYEPQPPPISMQQEVMMSMMGGGNPALALLGQQQAGPGGMGGAPQMNPALGFNGMVDFSNPASVGNMQNSLQNDPNFIANQNAVLNMMNQVLGAMPNVHVSPAAPPPPQWGGGFPQPFPNQMVGNNFGLNPNFVQQTQFQNPLDGVVPANPDAVVNSTASWYGGTPFPMQNGLGMQPNMVGGWNAQPSYYNFYMNDPANREAYMRFTQEEIDAGIGFKVKIVSKTDEEIRREKEQDALEEQALINKHLTWDDKFKNINFKTVMREVDIDDLPEPIRRIRMEQESQAAAEKKAKEEAEANKPSRVIIECLHSEIEILRGWIYRILPKDIIGLNAKEIIVPKPKRLFFNKRDEEALRNLCKKLEVYNPALARVVWSKRHLKYRDDYNIFIEVAEDNLREYEIDEMFDKREEGYNDYRVPMHCREIPGYTINEKGEKEFDEEYCELYPFIRYTDKNYKYEFDRGRKLTNEEFNVFCEYEEMCLVYGFHQLRLKKLLDDNRKRQELPLSYSVDRRELATREEKIRNLLVESNGSKETTEEENKMEQQCKNNKVQEDPRTLEQIENEYYNKFDPIETHYHEMRVMRKKQQQQYELYRDIFSSKSQKDFDAWWYGKNSSQYQQENLSPEELKKKQRQEYVDRMTEANIALLSKATPIDPVQFVNNFRYWQQQQLQKLFGNTMNEATTAKDVFEKVIPHALYEISCENIERQRQEAMNRPYNPMAYKRALIELANKKILAGNEDPNFKPGPVDPKFGYPSNWVDPTNSKEYEERKAQFMEYCRTSMGVNMPLRPIYK